VSAPPTGISSGATLSPQPRRHAGAVLQEGLRHALDDDLNLLASGLAPLLKDSIGRDPTGETMRIRPRPREPGRPACANGVWVSADGAHALILAQTRAAGFDIDAQEHALNGIRQAFAAAPGSGDVQMLATAPGSSASRRAPG